MLRCLSLGIRVKNRSWFEFNGLGLSCEAGRGFRALLRIEVGVAQGLRAAPNKPRMRRLQSNLVPVPVAQKTYLFEELYIEAIIRNP